MDTGLAGKVVFVTGASGGIGRAMAEAFGAEGARLALGSHRHTEELERWIDGQPWRESALSAGADVADADAMTAAVDRVLDRFGRLAVCIANAGIWPPEDRPPHTLDEARVRNTVEVNLLGATWTARAFLRGLSRTGPRDDGHGASLVLVGSTAGRFGERGHCDYALSKAGLAGLVHTLKHEIVDLDPFGRVNMIDPGWTVTHMARPALSEPGRIASIVRTMPLRQLGRAADVARTALWLASPTLARHVTGQIVTVAGGMDGRVRWEADAVDEDAVRRRLEQE